MSPEKMEAIKNWNENTDKETGCPCVLEAGGITL
jgi:hypothetical protein